MDILQLNLVETMDFGFDKIFELESGKTLAELSPEEKNSMSSRKIALEKVKKFLNT